jgi:sugar (pentulose or hexulose) kinase
MTPRDPHWLGVDNGGTVTKAAVFDAEGRELAVVARRVNGQSPRPGWAERDPDAIRHDTADCIREAVATAGIPAAAIAAVGCTGYGNGLHLLDAAGRPVRPFIGSGDTRARDWVDRQMALGDGRGDPAPHGAVALAGPAAGAPRVAPRTRASGARRRAACRGDEGCHADRTHRGDRS